jgi:enamine deaminase RidA (YjgF/YER057c/UK114 family)/catechol 2,3-dioxygenase-like lactoylglutathione lyase family enzyme
MSVEKRLAELGITLPEPPAAVASYVPWVITGQQVMTSGQLPFHDGELVVGKLGGDLSDEDGYSAARYCAINAIAQLKAATGDLERIARITRLEGNVHSAPGFQGHPQVLNGASELMAEVFGERGRHTRTALGINEMPLGAAVQLSVFAELKPAADTTQSSSDELKTELAHCTLATRDVAKTSEFFLKTLNWQPIPRPGNIDVKANWLQIGPNQELHLLEIDEFEPTPYEREFGRHIAFTYPLEDFDGLKSRLIEHGAEIIPARRATSFERFFFRDPNGYVFEVVQTDHASA